MPFIFNVVTGKKKGGGGNAISLTSCTIASAGFSSFLLNNTGTTVWAWGDNSYSQLGDGTSTIRYTPVSVVGASKTFVKISAGFYHTLAIDKNGQAWAWGNGYSGQLGDNSGTLRNTPVSVAGATKTFCEIAAGQSHTVAIDKNGQAWGWGNNSNGRLGDNSTTLKYTPVSVLGTTKTFCQIAAGFCHTVAIDKNGKSWGWGVNNGGQLGDNSITSRLTPVSVLGATKTFCQIAAGNVHTVAIDKNGRAWGWGGNVQGQLGDNSYISQRTPVSVLGATKTFCQIAAGFFHAVAIDKNGQAWAWGGNGQGQLGDNSNTPRLTPVSVAGATKTFCQIKSGAYHTIALDYNNNLWGWGYDLYGGLGTNNELRRCTPVSVAGATKTFCQIAAGVATSTAIDKNGRAWSWGLSNYGQLGDNSTTSRVTPVSVLGATKTFCQISLNSHIVAIDKNGQAWGWGNNNFGQLGDDSITNRCTPVSVGGLPKIFCQISVAGNHTIAIDNRGFVWTWGINGQGQLGDNSITSRRTPVQVAGLPKNFCQIAGGSNHTVAIDNAGQAWGWGYNIAGQLGNNSYISQRTPVSVLGATKTFCQIAAGSNHTIAIDKNGKVWGWGNNQNGQLGNNSTTARCTPVSVLGTTKTFCQITAGNYVTFAIDKNGRAWGWGSNASGEIGDNSTITRYTPVSVGGVIKTFCHISSAASGQHTTAIDKNGQVWSWGTRSQGRLGDNYMLSTRTPVRVCNL